MQLPTTIIISVRVRCFYQTNGTGHNFRRPTKYLFSPRDTVNLSFHFIKKYISDAMCDIQLKAYGLRDSEENCETFEIQLKNVKP